VRRKDRRGQDRTEEEKVIEGVRGDEERDGFLHVRPQQAATKQFSTHRRGVR
jgi:hypothetical protein